MTSNTTKDVKYTGHTFFLEGKFEDRLPEDIRHRKVTKVEFVIHLPYLLKQNCPTSRLVKFLEMIIDFQLENATRSVTYEGANPVDQLYTKCLLTISWESDAPTLHSLLREPVVRLAEFPMELLNGLVDAYQIMTGDFTVHRINTLEIPYYRGSVHVDGSDTPLTIEGSHWKTQPDTASVALDPEEWLYVSSCLLGSAPIWNARRLFYRARRGFFLGDVRAAYVDLVTCVEILAGGLAANRKGVSRFQGGLVNALRNHLRNAGSDDNPVALLDAWARDVYRIRNRIVHEGKLELGRNQAQGAIELTGRLAQLLEHTLPSSAQEPAP